jgi:hypothetical protein
MKSLSRKWSVMPSRAINDRELKERELRVLGALCVHTNAAGVCWPSMETLCAVTGLASRQSIHNAMKVLKRKRYVRQLQPKDYQETATGWKSNRYQVLWDGDEALPTYEEVDSAKPLQLREDQGDKDVKEIGGLGDLQSLSHTHGLAGRGQPKLTEIELTSRNLAQTYIRAVMQATGQVRLIDNEMSHARRLANAGFTAADVEAATLNTCDKAIERRAGVPSLYDVAVGMGL